ncbi:hypothetical protein PR202_ga22268 [Eleusine coracana subsp. coracana]|uniref:S-acyltransferase n=1 Tax=Eleusine coracana subsp. coracana TaxID=191504 RepID=A0AAV5D2M0_ELECO|nr:hypothetical protein PR202_ga22268 [Eleusine coracana subsp. coracana]
MMKGRTLFFKSPLHHRSHLSDAASSASSAAAGFPSSHRLYQVWRGRNRFLCGGRLIFGPDASSIVLTLALIMTPLALFLGFVSFRLADLIGKPLGLAVPVTAIVVGVFDVVVLVLTSGRDPGIIPRNARPPDPEEFAAAASPAAANSTAGAGGLRTSWSLPPTRDVYVNGMAVKVKYCHTCMLYRPPRCSHCSVCNNCVERFDHHCPWVGQCIGKRNYRFFFMFISSTTFLCLYVFGFCWVNLLLITRQYNCGLARAAAESPVSGFLIAYTFVTAWFVGGLTAFHSYLVCTNQTTYENFRYRYDGGKANPFNRGAANNVAEIFLAPIPPPRADFRARVSMSDPDAVALYYSLGPLASESRISFYTRGSLSFDMAKASFDLDYSSSAGNNNKRTSVASSDFEDIVYGYGHGGMDHHRCSTTQPRHSIFGAGRESRKVEDEADAVTVELTGGSSRGYD